MKHLSSIAAIISLASLSACDSSDMPIQHADSYGYITFSAQSQKILTRTNPYEAYNPERHPATMGVFGYQDNEVAEPIFHNETATYNASTQSWTTTPPKRWADYPNASSFNFFAYMPHTEGATLKRTLNGTGILSFPFSMENATSPVIFDTKAAPIICALPISKGAITTENEDRVINLKFDQTLTGYSLSFRLDAKMNAIRHFRIHSVTLSGNLATSCTITRSYTWNNVTSSWSASEIGWSDVKRAPFVDTPIPYKSYGSEAYDDATQTAIVTSEGYTQWGSDFFTIPDADFTPKIKVTYDVELIAEDGTTVVTRKNVTSVITLNKDNFGNLTTGKTAMINPIRILIQPRYLYVLADQDAYTGHLLID
ncbi:hypothetical protein [Prevotella sp.]|uniref:hypothetical protein n=1 Tax=Prevotella sp. TaxID=59823 RepID=UPI00307C2757